MAPSRMIYDVLIHTGEWRTPDVAYFGNDQDLLYIDDGNVGSIAVGEQDYELVIVEQALRERELRTPRSVAAVCQTANTPPQDLLERLSASLKTEACRLLGESVSVEQQRDGDEVIFVVGYQPDAESSSDQRVEQVSSLRLFFVQQIPEQHSGQISVYIEPTCDAV